MDAVQVELGGARASSGTDADALAALEPADRTVDVLSADHGRRPRWVRLAPPHGRGSGRTSAHRIARAREGLVPFMPAGAREILVATHAGDPAAEPVPGAEAAVDSVTREGVDALREVVLAALSTPVQ